MPGKAAASAKEILPGWEPGIDAGGICPLGADSAVDWPGTAGPAAGSGLRYGNPSQRSEVFNRAGRQNWPGGNLLKGKGDKREIRDKYIRSEKMINRLELSGMDKESHEIFCSMDIKQWINLKRNNWFISYNLLKEKFTILEPKMDTIWQPFSLVILCDSVQERIRLRKYLIENRIYPAILWELPESITSFELLDFSQRMLSIHCDGRYSENEIKQMCQIINSYYD